MLIQLKLIVDFGTLLIGAKRLEWKSTAQFKKAKC